MSDLRRRRTVRRIASVIGLAAFAAGSAQAQTAADYRRQLDELEPAWRAASAAVKEAERARRVTARSVPVERGHLRLLVDSAISDVVAASIDSAARNIEQTFGTSALQLREHPIVIRTRAVVRGGETTQVIGLRGPTREQTVSLDDARTMNEQLVAALGGPVVVSTLHASLDDTLRSWFQTPLTATGASPAPAPRIHTELVTASTPLSRRCLAGEVAGCRQLLGLSPTVDILVEGHTAVDRRRLVVARRELRAPATAAEYDRCVREDDDAACIARLRESLIELSPWSGSSATVRHSFSRFVLARGGEGAYPRLRDSRGLPLDERFAAAGGMPADSLVSLWHARVVSTRPTPSSVPPATAAATLAWVLACGALALRSSRWR